MSSNQMRHSASSPNLTGSSTGLRRSVSFHKVEIREYDVTVGDNPSCRTGPALQLDVSRNAIDGKMQERYSHTLIYDGLVALR